jgi:hypothetical protein
MAVDCLACWSDADVEADTSLEERMLTDLVAGTLMAPMWMSKKEALTDLHLG